MPWLCIMSGVLSCAVRGLLPNQALRHVPEAPQLPACYPAMMILALCPPLFSYVMDPRVLAYSGSRRATPAPLPTLDMEK